MYSLRASPTFCSFIFFAALAPSARAVDRTWINPAGGSFSIPTNWSGSVVPTATDSANFNLDSTYPITFPSDITNDRLVLHRGALTLDIGTHAYTLTNASALPTSPSLTIGEIAADSATFTLTHGRLAAVNAVFARDAHSTANATIANPGATLSFSGDLTVGQYGKASLFVLNGGSVSARNLNVAAIYSSTADVVVDGAGSVLSAANDIHLPGTTNAATTAGQSTLTVRNGGAVKAANFIYLSNTANLQGGSISAYVLDIYGTFNQTGGTLNLGNTGAATAPGLYAGFTSGANGGGSFLVGGGGHANTTGPAFLGYLAGGGGGVQVDGDNSVWTHNGDVTIGAAGFGDVAAQSAGAIKTNGSLYLARDPGSFGRGYSAYANSRWDVSNDIYIGQRGEAQFAVEDGGTLTNVNAYLATFPGSTTNVWVTSFGSQWLTSGSLYIGGSDSGPGGTATLYVGLNQAGQYDSSVSAAVRTKVWPGGRLLIAHSAFVTPELDIEGGEARGPAIISSAPTTKEIFDGTLIGGGGGAGTLNITSGGHLASYDAYVGLDPASTGTVNITGTNTQWTALSLYLGGDSAAPGGAASVTLQNNSALNVTGPITLWSAATLRNYAATISTPELRLRGGTFSAYGTFSPAITSAGGVIDVPISRSLSLSGPLATNPSSTLDKTGDGTLIITGPQSHSPGASLRITRGQLILSSNAGPNLSLSITSNTDSAPATVTFKSDQDLENLSIDFASLGLQTLDLAGHTLTIHSPDLASAKSSLLAALRNAKSNPLDGLTDITLSSNSTIALLEFPDHLLLRQALIGDLNLDGSVTIADFIELASHFNGSGPQISWTDGDLNYDSTVTIADFIDLASNFGASYAGTTIPISPADQQLLATFAAANVPEPLSTSLLLAFFPLLARRFSQSRRT